MKVIHNYSGDATWGVIPYIQNIFDSLSEEDSDIVFFNGFSFMDHIALREPYKDYRRKCLLAHWSPCEFMTRKDYHYFDSYEFFTDVYTVCPFSGISGIYGIYGICPDCPYELPCKIWTL